MSDRLQSALSSRTFVLVSACVDLKGRDGVTGAGGVVFKTSIHITHFAIALLKNKIALQVLEADRAIAAAARKAMTLSRALAEVRDVDLLE